MFLSFEIEIDTLRVIASGTQWSVAIQPDPNKDHSGWIAASLRKAPLLAMTYPTLI